MSYSKFSVSAAAGVLSACATFIFGEWSNDILALIVLFGAAVVLLALGHAPHKVADRGGRGLLAGRLRHHALQFTAPH